MRPYVCPVCEGRGTVPEGFYDGPFQEREGQEKCKSCDGTGVIMTEPPVVYPPAICPCPSETRSPWPPFYGPMCGTALAGAHVSSSHCQQ